MKVITDKELDDTTVQIKCGENYGTAFLINENTAITVKHWNCSSAVVQIW